jgi:ADP-ribose pyrophosphatase YjhB (NUDIX family)
MSDTPLHSVSVAGVTFDDAGRVLLIKRRDNGHWQAPGGVLELGETIEDGGVREVLEETGVRVAVDHLTGVYKNIKKGVVSLVFKCRAVDGVPGPTAESSEAAWIDQREARALMTEAFAIRVQDAQVPVGSPAASRSHDGTNLI